MEYIFNSISGGAFDSFLPNGLLTKENSISLGVSTKKGEQIGVIVALVKKFQIEIVWLYIKEDCRRKGAGTALLRELLRVIRESGEIYPVSIMYDTGDEAVERFIEHSGLFSMSFCGWKYEISSERRKSSKEVIGLIKNKERGVSLLFEQPDKLLSGLYSTVAKRGMNLKQLIAESEGGCIRELSLCHVGSRIDSFILVRELSEYNFEIAYAYAENKLSFARLIIALLRRIDENYDSAKLTITALNYSSERLISHLFGVDTPAVRIMRADWNYRLD